MIAAGIRESSLGAQLDKGSARAGQLRPPKLVDISKGRVEVVQLAKPPTARELEGSIGQSVFTGKGDRAVVIKQMRDYRHILEGVGAKSLGVMEVVMRHELPDQQEFMEQMLADSNLTSSMVTSAVFNATNGQLPGAAPS